MGESGFSGPHKQDSKLFRGINKISIDSKGRLAIPSCHREFIRAEFDNLLTLTVSPYDRTLWLYPRPEWEKIETKLAALSDFYERSRRHKQMMRSHACDCEPDGQGRILINKELRSFAGLSGPAIVSGQDNKFEIWDEKAWASARDKWLESVGAEVAEAGSDSACEALKAIAF